MTLLAALLSRPRIVLGLPTLLALAGVLASQTMPRQEDPRLPARWAFLTTPFEGASAEQVERLVLEPLEKRLAEVENVTRIESTARTEVAVTEIELSGDVYDSDGAWDEVRRALEDARRDFPEGVGAFDLNDDVVTPESIVLALTGRTGLLSLLEAAERLKRELLSIPSIKRIRIVGDPGQEVVVRLDDAAARQVALDRGLLARQLTNRNTIQSAGALHLSDRRVGLRMHSDFRSIAEIGRMPLLLSTGASIPLESIADIRKEPREPPRELMRFDGTSAVGLAVSPRRRVDVVRLGEEVRSRIDELRGRYPQLSIHEAMFQPDRVATRFRQLGAALLIGIAVLAGVLFATMGARMGLVVTAIIPLVTFSSLALYAAGGGILHQLSIAALVISLGLIVDTAIVVTEGIQRHIDAGAESDAAARRTVRELAAPLGASTATTLAAFIPMYLSRGTSADFVRAIPVVVMTSLAVSYVFGLSVTPALARTLLKRRESSGPAITRAIAGKLAALGTEHPRAVLLTAAVMIALCAAGALGVEQRFFPAADRDQLIVTLELPEGAHISASDRATRRLEQALQENPDVESISSFVGRATPLFYYNINRHPSSPHFAQIVVRTSGLAALEPVAAFVRRFAGLEIPEASVSVRRLAQGMPIDAPIEIRLYGPDRPSLQDAAETVLRALREVPGTADVRHDLGVGVPSLRFTVNDAVASRYGIKRGDIAQALLSTSNGFAAGQYRAGIDPVPIVVRSPEGESLPASRLMGIDVVGADGTPVPLAQLANLDVEWRPSATHRRNRQRVVTVASNLEGDATSARVLRRVRRAIGELELPQGTRIEFGGEAEGSAAATGELLRHLPVGLLLLLFFLLAEFNSFRRLGIILASVALASVGIIPGLLLSGRPFGFMSILGTLALVGIVVNNAIVLLDVVERRRAGGDPVAQALRVAVHLRIRPILLTTATTITGLLPLALSGTELWPPMAWAMISGLTASALLTLVVVPALYQLVFRDRGNLAQS